MNGKQSEEREALLRLADAMAEDAMTASDADIAAEAREDGEDLHAVAAKMLALFDRAESEAGKSRMAAARRELDAQRRSAPRVLRLDPATARARLQRALEQSPETAKKLTLAARKGEDISDEDVLAMLEDLEELGIIPPEGDEGDKA
jgi:hypothetical protein